MQGVHLRKYGVETIINFELYEVDGVDLRTDAADAGSDCNIRKDQGADATCTNDFVDEGISYSITLTAGEMEAKCITLHIIDSATKAWLDKTIEIETYGNASAQHAFDLDTALADATVGTCTTNTDMVGTNSAALASVVGALADVASAGEVTEADTLMQYLKQLINILIGAPGIVAFPAEAAPANGVSIAEVLRAVAIDVATTIPGTISTAQTELNKIGTIPALDGGGQTIGAAIAKLADDNNGATFDAGTDSLNKIRDRGDAAWAGAPESVSGTCTVETPDTVFNLTATLGTLSDQDDAYHDMVICFFDNSGSIYETKRITDYVGASTRVTIHENLSFPVEDGVDTFTIYRAGVAPVGAASITEGDMNTIVDKMHDEDLLAAHKTVGSAGYFLRRSGSRY